MWTTRATFDTATIEFTKQKFIKAFPEHSVSPINRAVLSREILATTNDR